MAKGYKPSSLFLCLWFLMFLLFWGQLCFCAIWISAGHVTSLTNEMVLKGLESIRVLDFSCAAPGNSVTIWETPAWVMRITWLSLYHHKSQHWAGVSRLSSVILIWPEKPPSHTTESWELTKICYFKTLIFGAIVTQPTQEGLCVRVWCVKMSMVWSSHQLPGGGQYGVRWH